MKKRLVTYPRTDSRFVYRRYDWNSRRTGRENAVDAAFCRIWAVRT